MAAGGGGFAGKPRPYVVVQSNDYVSTTLILVGCHGVAGTRTALRPLLQPNAGNGLRKLSEVTVDLPVTMRTDRIAEVIGRLNDDELASVDAALLLILGLA